jgi:hypothetical protein
MSVIPSSTEDQEKAMEESVLDAVGNFGVPAVIHALIKACATAYEVEIEQEPLNWPKLESYKHYARRLEDLVS